MAAKTTKLKCKRNPRNKQFYTTLKSRNSRKEFTLGEGMHKRFTEKDRQRLIRDLTNAEIVYE